MTRVAIVRFPGSNCEPDTYRAVARAGGVPSYVFHRERSLADAEAVILPGGFSYGDYLRTGAIARFAPIMAAVERFAADGKPVLGICNGFQILCEAGLLPGALMRNASLRFVSRPVDLRIERTDTPFTTKYRPNEVIRIPVGHGDGRYTGSEEVVAELEATGRVVLRYIDSGMLDAESNPNGAVHGIAGICNPDGNVVGIMPHPERLADPVLGGDAGARFFTSLVNWSPVAIAPVR